MRHQALLAKEEGIFVEPTSSAALAGLHVLKERAIIDDDESVVVELTGFGLKDIHNAALSLRWSSVVTRARLPTA